MSVRTRRKEITLALSKSVFTVVNEFGCIPLLSWKFSLKNLAKFNLTFAEVSSM